MKFKAGDKVKMLDQGRYVYGEITIVKEMEQECKVIWDGDCDLNYWYYPIRDLQLAEKRNE